MLLSVVIPIPFPSLVPRPLPAFGRLQYGYAGEGRSGKFPHVSDVKVVRLVERLEINMGASTGARNSKKSEGTTVIHTKF